MSIIIHTLWDGRVAPAGADWAHLKELPDGSWNLSGNLEPLPGVMSRYGDHPNHFDALHAAIDEAMNRGVDELYIETNARF